MTLLVLFAIAAGAGTALSPCVLPGAAGSCCRRARPAGGAGRSAIVARAGDDVHDHDGRARLRASSTGSGSATDTLLRTLAVIAALLAFGVALLVPRGSRRAWIER